MSEKTSILGERYEAVQKSIDTYIVTRCSSYNELKSPLFVGWEVTANCNLKCCHCRAADNDSRNTRSYLSTEACRNVIDKLSEAQVYTVGLTGGEPFVRQDILEIIEYCKAKGLQLIIYTNATLISDEAAIRLGQLLDKHDIMHVSLDSSIPEIHNAIRGSDCFDSTLKGLERLTNQKLTIRLNVVPTSINIDSIWGIIDIAEKYHVKYFSGSPLMTIGRGKNDALVPDPQKMYALEKAIYERMINSSVEFEGGISGALCTMYEFRHEIANDFPNRQKPQRRVCDAGTRKLFIDALGNCYPCSLFALDTRFCIGNINELSLSEIWHNKKLSLFKNGVAINEKICLGCELWDICDDGCMALSFNHYRSLKAPDPRCKHVQEILER